MSTSREIVLILLENMPVTINAISIFVGIALWGCLKYRRKKEKIDA